MTKKNLQLVAIAVTSIVVLLSALPYLVDVDRFRPQFESNLSSALGREVHIGHMQLSLLSGGARVEQISVADDPAFGNNNFLQAKSLGVGVSLVSLIFSHSLHVNSLELEEPQMTAIQSSDGKWNFSTLGSSGSGSQEESMADSMKPSAQSITLDHLRISKATIEVTSAGSQAVTLKNIDLDLKNVSLERAMSFVLSTRGNGGELNIKGNAGPINRTNPETTPFTATLTAHNADLAQITSLGASSPLAGMLNLDATVTSDGQTIRSEGKASAERLRLVHGGQASRQGLALQYASEYSVARKTGVVRNSTIAIGNTSATLSGTFDGRGKELVFHLKLKGNGLRLESVEAVLPAIGVELPGGSKIKGGTMNATLSIDGSASQLVTSGNAQISNAHLSGFDLGSKLASLPGASALKGNTDLSISTLASNLRISPEGVHLSSFNGVFSGIGSITGDGDISSNNQLQFKMVAHVPSDGAVRFGLNHVGLRNMPNEIPFEVVGTTSLPVILPDLSAMAKNGAKATAKQVAANVVKSQIKTIAAPQSKTQAPEAQQASAKKSGFFHRLFGRKDKHNNAASSTELAAQKVKF